MASTYPTSLDSFSTAHADNVGEVIHASTDNDHSDAINKIEATLGISPAGTFSTVASRLAALDTPTFNTQTGTTYTLVLSDFGKIVGMNNASANTLTIPTNASVAFPVGTQLTIRQAGVGQTTIAPASGVTMNSRGSANKIAGQYGYATIAQVAANTWELTGDITT